ncbi:MAG: TAXI family TRAP transporter solute-binding subunit [Paracoccaceae bacterium]
MTKTFWEQRDEMGSAAAWWNGISPDMIANITTSIHPGAIRYYEETGATITDAHR